MPSDPLSDIDGPGESHHNVNPPSVLGQFMDEEIEALIRWGAGPYFEREPNGLCKRGNELQEVRRKRGRLATWRGKSAREASASRVSDPRGKLWTKALGGGESHAEVGGKG